MLSNIPIVNSSYDILQYMPEENYITKVFIIDSHKYSLINYPFTKSTPLAIINLTKTTESNSLLNITIKNFTNIYDDNSLCRYGGIIFYDMISGRKIKAQSVCENYREFYKHRNIYSRDSEMLLTMYSYDDYGELHAILNISITDCRLTYKNRYICSYDFYCTPKHFHFRRKRQFCNYLLIKTDTQYIKDNINATFTHLGGIMNKENGCVIFQFVQDINLFVYKVLTFVRKNKHCNFFLAQDYADLINKKRRMALQVTGFFTGMLLITHSCFSYFVLYSFNWVN